MNKINFFPHKTSTDVHSYSGFAQNSYFTNKETLQKLHFQELFNTVAIFVISFSDIFFKFFSQYLSNLNNKKNTFSRQWSQLLTMFC